jgi:predicted phosphodiesterase
MSIICIGDIHGYTNSYKKWIERNLDPSTRSFQIGDMGYGFAGTPWVVLSNEHKFFRGNHDSPQQCRQHPNYLGDYGYLEQDKLFWCAGAWSIDRAYRTVGVSWWPDEELSFEELGKAADLYVQSKPRFVLSHEAPSEAAKNLLYTLLIGNKDSYFTEKLQCSMSRTSEALQYMLDRHQPEKWIFGHYHVDRKFAIPGCKTEFVCVGGIMTSGENPHTYELKTGTE